MRFVYLVMFFFCFVFMANGQPGDPGGGGVPGVPITGIEYLIGLGGFLGVKKLVQSWKQRSK